MLCCLDLLSCSSTSFRLAASTEFVAVDMLHSGMSDQIRKAAGRAWPWAFLSPELLADVCTRLHDAADFVSFHAVCVPWRDAAPSMLSPATPHHTFLPWLVSQSCGRIIHSPVTYFGRRASPEPKLNGGRRGCKVVVLTEPGASSTGGDRNWVGSTDGRSAWIFARGPEPTLSDLVTGDVTRMPPFPADKDEMSNPCGIMYIDGTIFLYSFEPEKSGNHHRYKTTFKVAIRRPGDTAWTVVETRLVIPAAYHSCAAYHGGGEVLVWVGVYFWCLVTPDFEAGSSTETTYAMLETTWDRLEDEYYERGHSYVLEFRGELLWPSILVEHRRRDGGNACYNVTPTLAMRVHALEEEDEDGGGGKMRWVERDDRSLGDRVLFLGSLASFAADATELGVDGGCAYFVFNSQVFRYSFVDGEAKPVEWMCPGRGSSKGRLWLRPQPGIAPILEIRKRFETQNTKKQKLI